MRTPIKTACEALLPTSSIINAASLLEQLKDHPLEYFRLPPAIRERGGEFVCFVFVSLARGGWNRVATRLD